MLCIDKHICMSHYMYRCFLSFLCVNMSILLTYAAYCIVLVLCQVLRRIKYPGAVELIARAAASHISASSSTTPPKAPLRDPAAAQDSTSSNSSSSGSGVEGYVDVGSSEVMLNSVSFTAEDGVSPGSVAVASRVIIVRTSAVARPAGGGNIRMKICLALADGQREDGGRERAGAEIYFDSAAVHEEHIVMLIRTFINESSVLLSSDASSSSSAVANSDIKDLDFHTVAKVRAILNERNAGNANISLKSLLRSARDQLQRQVALLGEQCSLMAFCRIGFTLGRYSPWSVQWIDKALMMKAQSSVSSTYMYIYINTHMYKRDSNYR